MPAASMKKPSASIARNARMQSTVVKGSSKDLVRRVHKTLKVSGFPKMPKKDVDHIMRIVKDSVCAELNLFGSSDLFGLQFVNRTSQPLMAGSPEGVTHIIPPTSSLEVHPSREVQRALTPSRAPLAPPTPTRARRARA